jgi:phospholipid transport system substrate-binding protein
MKRRALMMTLAAAAGAGIAPIARADAPGAVPAAEEFIRALVNRALANVFRPALPAAERARRFRAILVESLDVPTIGRFVLGRYWRIATDAERVEYQRLFEDMLVAIYSPRLADYSGEQVRVTGSRVTADGDIIVSSLAALPQQPQESATVEWILRRDGTGFKVMDLRAEGVSMAITQRDEFASVIQRGGGTIAALLNVMRTRAAQH